MRLFFVALLLSGCNSVLGLKEGHPRTADGGPADAPGPTIDGGAKLADAARIDGGAPKADAAKIDGGKPDAGVSVQCGNSIVDAGEICDDGPMNGTVVGGCNATCNGYVPCSIMKQDCPTGFTCDLKDPTTCTAGCRTAGAVQLNQVCTSSKDCGLGLTCVAGSATDTNGSCKGLCDENGAGCPGGTTCSFSDCQAGTAQINVCGANCDPMQGTGCMANESCVSASFFSASANMSYGFTDCWLNADVTLTAGADCSSNALGCKQDETCYFPNESSTSASCVPLCHGSGDCVVPTPTCTPFPGTGGLVMPIGTSFNYCK